jgi:hypothetical protein
MVKPYKVLGTYRWPKGKRYARFIGRDLIRFTKKLGYKPFPEDNIKRNLGAAWSNYKYHAEVRMTAVPESEGTEWHQDGDTTVPDNMDFGLIVWANKNPTEFQTKDGKIWQPEPFEVVYIGNLDCYHRRPPGLSGRRWHFRQRVKI